VSKNMNGQAPPLLTDTTSRNARQPLKLLSFF
jgi:hypothetical protein